MDITFFMTCFAEGIPPLESSSTASWPSSALPAPKDGIELGERIHAFWSAFSAPLLCFLRSFLEVAMLMLVVLGLRRRQRSINWEPSRLDGADHR